LIAARSVAIGTFTFCFTWRCASASLKSWSGASYKRIPYGSSILPTHGPPPAIEKAAVRLDDQVDVVADRGDPSFGRRGRT
jgi:hypothetical protein